jgi:hypothetical protein
VCAAELNSNTLYFYSPEINTARNTVLKGTFDQYFATQGAYLFQPVKEQAVFENLLLSDQVDGLIMSFDHFSHLINTVPEISSRYSRVLQGEKNGSDTYLKLLVSTNVSTSYSGQVLASSQRRAFTLSMLDRIFPDMPASSVDGLNILEVPKDIDALMAVGFGLANMALTTDDSLSTLSALYKEQYGQMNIVGKSIPQKRMILVLPKSSIDDGALLGGVIYSMPQSALGRRVMKLLGLDSWRWLLDKEDSQGGKK